MPPRPRPGSKADRDALRSELLAVGAPLSVIAAEMRARFGLRPREAWRHAHGWTLQEAADRVHGIAGASGPAADASLVGKWEKWPDPAGRRVPLPVLTVLAELYGAMLEDLLDLEDRRALPDSDLRMLQHHQAGAVPAVVAPAAPVPAPPLMQAVPPTGTDLVRTAARESADWARWAEVTNVGPIALEQLTADTRDLAGAYLMAEDPLEVFVQTKRQLNGVWDLLYGRQRPQQRRKLFTVPGYLFALMSWMTSDLGHRAQAETHARAALLCADSADDPGLHAWVASTRSKLAFWDGQYRQAVQHVQLGASHQAPGTVTVLLHCQLADAWAEVGARTRSSPSARRRTASPSPPTSRSAKRTCAGEGVRGGTESQRVKAGDSAPLTTDAAVSATRFWVQQSDCLVATSAPQATQTRLGPSWPSSPQQPLWRPRSGCGAVPGPSSGCRMKRLASWLIA